MHLQAEEYLHTCQEQNKKAVGQGQIDWSGKQKPSRYIPSTSVSLFYLCLSSVALSSKCMPCSQLFIWNYMNLGSAVTKLQNFPLEMLIRYKILLHFQMNLFLCEEHLASLPHFPFSILSTPFLRCPWKCLLPIECCKLCEWFTGSHQSVTRAFMIWLPTVPIKHNEFSKITDFLGGQKLELTDRSKSEVRAQRWWSYLYLFYCYFDFKVR